MWKLLHHNRLICFNKNLLFSKIPKIKISNYIANSIKANVQRKPAFLNVKTVGISLTGGLIVKLYISRNQVECEAQNTRLSRYENSDKTPAFDWKLLWKYLRPSIWYFIAAVVGALAVALLNIQIPQVLGGVVNVLIRYNDNESNASFISEVKNPVFQLVSMYVAQSACTFFYIFMLSNLGEQMAYKMRTDLFSSIVNQDIAFFDNHRTGEIINRLTTDIQDFKSSFKQIVSGGLRATTQIIGCTFSLISISPQMTLMSLMSIPTVILVGTVFGSLLRAISRRAQAQMEKTTAVADEAVSNIRTVRAFAMEDEEKQLYNDEAALAMLYNENLGMGIGLFQAGTNIFINSMVLSTLYMGGYLLSTNQLSAGEVMAYLMASQTIQRSLAQISLLFGSVVRGLAAGSRVFEYINMKPTMSLRGGKILPYQTVKGDIEFKNVSFAYPTRSEQVILHNFNLTVPSGKTVAIVGASGNGKSTVVALLERFYDINDGSILLDGHDIKSLDPSWLRGNILGLISQEPVLFGTSIMENIRYGKPGASDEEVKQAAHLANADDFINKFPKGYNTHVGERGVTLSGGQKQRIAIARALLKNPVVLLLDEATSALDSQSEKVVQAALERAREGRTVIVIAHRLSTIQNADLIVVLNKGRIVEMGTHESLQKLKGYYWSLVYQQQGNASPAG